jgi:hypothetical protein
MRAKRMLNAMDEMRLLPESTRNYECFNYAKKVVLKTFSHSKKKSDFVIVNYLKTSSKPLKISVLNVFQFVEASPTYG